jgi:hypothetical protein
MLGSDQVDRWTASHRDTGIGVDVEGYKDGKWIGNDWAEVERGSRGRVR